MTDEERRIITDYVMRVAGVQQAAPASSGPWGGRVPQTGAAPAQPLPPVEPQADALIAQLFQQYPEARFRLTQTAFVQEHALVAAQNRIQELEWELENANRQAQAAQNRGFLGFGGSRPAPMPPRPQPMQAPGGALPAGRQGPGFLATAAMTAAGVAGGIILGNMLMNAFSGSGGAAQAASGGAFGQDPGAGASPWTDPGAAAQQSGWGSGGNDASGSYDQGQDATGGYDDAGGGYDDEEF